MSDFVEGPPTFCVSDGIVSVDENLVRGENGHVYIGRYLYVVTAILKRENDPAYAK